MEGIILIKEHWDTLKSAFGTAKKAAYNGGVLLMAEDNIVFVGKKGTMSYVLAVVTQMNQGAKTVQIKARGRAISRAVDVAEIVKNRFLSDLKLGTIEIGTEELKSKENEPVNVSTIKIQLNK